MTPMSSFSHHPDLGTVYVGPSLARSLFAVAVALAAASR